VFQKILKVFHNIFKSILEHFYSVPEHCHKCFGTLFRNIKTIFKNILEYFQKCSRTFFKSVPEQFKKVLRNIAGIFSKVFPNIFQKCSGTIQKSAQEHCSETLRWFSKVFRDISKCVPEQFKKYSALFSKEFRNISIMFHCHKCFGTLFRNVNMVLKKSVIIFSKVIRNNS